jgi:hypothetical protein
MATYRQLPLVQDIVTKWRCSIEGKKGMKLQHLHTRHATSVHTGGCFNRRGAQPLCPKPRIECVGMPPRQCSTHHFFPITMLCSTFTLSQAPVGCSC